jgi:hypothetical protein
MILNRTVSISLVAIIFLSSCKTQPDINWNFSKTEITGNQSVNTNKLSVDIYLDATTSMKGFVSQTSTDYTKLLDDIEGSCQNVWKNTDIRYYKFGRTVDSISRNEFVSAKASPAMFSDPKLSTQTNFSEAVRNTNSQRVSILITDFFYNNSDINLVVSSVKDYCFQKGVEAGIVSLNSPFNGIVADVQPPVRVNGQRPLYVLVFGDKQNIMLLFNSLKNKPYIKQNRFLLVTNHPVENYEVTVEKNKTSKTFNKQSLKKEWKEYGTVFNFRMQEKANEALFNLQCTLQTNPYICPFTEKNLKTLVFKKTPAAKDSVAADNEVMVQNMKMTGNTLKADIRLTNNDEPGKYAYLVYLTFDNTVPLNMPQWVKEQSTETFAQGVNENKTLNLDKLLTDLTTNHITYAQPQLAKFYIYIEKK